MAGDPHSDHTVVLSVLPGEILDDRWRIESRAGAGAMGAVFKAKDLQDNRAVAIKILAPEHCRKPKVLARFEREAELMTTLRHPNIVQIYAHGRRGALPYIAMEFLEGMTLAEVIQQIGGSMPLPETVATVKQIASGLAFLHHHGLVHRDVKPQNIFMTTSGRVTILDLGVVRDTHNPGLTRPGAMVGTPYYMSPEQILGVDDIDKRTDVYALAAMTFELLTGRPPYLGNNNFEVLFGHKNTPPPNATDLNKAIPKQISQVLMKGLAKLREQRPESASELAFDMEGIAGVKKLDLAKSFPFLAEKAGGKTRIRKAMLPPENVEKPEKHGRSDKVTKKGGPSPGRKQLVEDVPMADSNDVVSVAERAEPTSPEMRSLGADHEDGGADDPFNSQTEAIQVAPSGLGGATMPELPKIEQVQTDAVRIAVAEDPAPPPVEKPVKQAAAGQLRVVTQMRGQAVKALLVIDGTSRGLTPKTVSLSPGKHTVRIEKKGAKSVERVVEVKKDDLNTIRVELPPS